MVEEAAGTGAVLLDVVVAAEHALAARQLCGCQAREGAAEGAGDPEGRRRKKGGAPRWIIFMSGSRTMSSKAVEPPMIIDIEFCSRAADASARATASADAEDYHHPQVNMVQACTGKEKPPRSTSRRLPRQDTPRKRQAATQKSAGISSRQVEGKCASVVELCARHGQHAKRDRRAWGSKTEA